MVFSDVNMPHGPDGHAFAAWLAEKHPTIPLLLTSSEAREATRAARGPLRKFVRKPYDLNAIEALFKAMIPS